MDNNRGIAMPSGSRRIAWLDCSKGLCIIFVVMLYATQLVAHIAGSAGWLEAVEMFVRPFRMPDFFLLSGLLLSRVIDRDWRTYLDRKVVHFAYFYVLWLTILFTFEIARTAAHDGWRNIALDYLEAYIRPYSMLWFIYMLPIFFVVTKALRTAPAVLVWVCASALQVAGLDSGFKVLDKFATYFVYFYTGFIAAPLLVRLADSARTHARKAFGALVLWAIANAYAVFGGYAAMPGVSLLLAVVGASAVIILSALTCHLSVSRPFSYCGRHSIVIYLAFYIPMTVTRKVANTVEIFQEPAALAAVSTAGGVLGALTLYWLLRSTRFRFLFERPELFSLRGTAWRSGARFAGERASNRLSMNDTSRNVSEHLS